MVEKKMIKKELKDDVWEEKFDKYIMSCCIYKYPNKNKYSMQKCSKIFKISSNYSKISSI